MNILVTGDWRHADFVDARLEMPRQTKFVDPVELEQIGSTPDLIVLAQSRRDQFGPALAERLRQRWPSSPAVQLLSSWHEGETRSGKPLSKLPRVLWHRWPAEFSRFQADRRARRPSRWDIDMTSSDRQLDPAILPGGKCLQVGVCTRWKSDGLMIDEMLSALGHVSQPIVDFATGPKPNRPLDAVLIVGDSLDEWLERQARSARLAQRRCLKIILMGFPRRFEVVRLQRAGGSGIRVISKPFDVGQIQQQLQDFAARSSPQGRLR